MDENQKMLGLMRYWLFGTFIIVFTAATVYVGGAVGTGLAIFRELNYWIAMVAAAVLCVGAYFVYKWWLGRNTA